MRTAPASIALLLLRVVLGVVFIAHGWQKLATQGIQGTSEGFAQMGVPLAEIAGPAVIALEIGGGVLLILGLATRVVGALLAIDMIVAWALVHAGSGFFAQDGGFEYVLVLTVIGAALAVAGPGTIALDAAVGGAVRSRRTRRGLTPARA
ncbi:DoxX family protein [Schumannella sp. 10F1B-5-1]|uniref:DoxX family protein n=1 Tax=Schumannella sp. 10F1B-5-1 TaxID=2590780 RepID=UPI001130BB2B|nr:DoxX family protein [Schumannella sp. 10F1B-5-1]TPW72329.1 DoxX family protein [Schumannella sp. 10F1B-5-1]